MNRFNNLNCLALIILNDGKIYDANTHLNELSGTVGFELNVNDLK